MASAPHDQEGFWAQFPAANTAEGHQGIPGFLPDRQRDSPRGRLGYSDQQQPNHQGPHYNQSFHSPQWPDHFPQSYQDPRHSNYMHPTQYDYSTSNYPQYYQGHHTSPSYRASPIYYPPAGTQPNRNAHGRNEMEYVSYPPAPANHPPAGRSMHSLGQPHWPQPLPNSQSPKLPTHSVKEELFKPTEAASLSVALSGSLVAKEPEATGNQEAAAIQDVEVPEEEAEDFKTKAVSMKRDYSGPLDSMISNMEDLIPGADSTETSHKYNEIQKKLTLLRTLITAVFKPNSNFPPRREILDAAERQIMMWMRQWEKLEKTGGGKPGVKINAERLEEMMTQSDTMMAMLGLQPDLPAEHGTVLSSSPSGEFDAFTEFNDLFGGDFAEHDLSQVYPQGCLQAGGYHPTTPDIATAQPQPGRPTTRRAPYRLPGGHASNNWPQQPSHVGQKRDLTNFRQQGQTDADPPKKVPR